MMTVGNEARGRLFSDQFFCDCPEAALDSFASTVAEGFSETLGLWIGRPVGCHGDIQDIQGFRTGKWNMRDIGHGKVWDVREELACSATVDFETGIEDLREAGERGGGFKRNAASREEQAIEHGTVCLFLRTDICGGLVGADLSEIDDGENNSPSKLVDEAELIGCGEDQLDVGTSGEELDDESQVLILRNGIAIEACGLLVRSAVVHAKGLVESWNAGGLHEDSLWNFEVGVPYAA